MLLPPVKLGQLTSAFGEFWEAADDAARACDLVVDCGGAILAPGLIDLQINGGWGVDFSSPSLTVEQALTVCRNVLRSGVTAANTLTLLGANTYTGATIVNGNVLVLAGDGSLDSTSSVTVNYAGLTFDNNAGLAAKVARINASADIFLNGGTLAFLGRQFAADTQAVGAVTLAQGLSTITSTPAASVSGGSSAADLTLASLARTENSGAMVNFTANTGLGTIGSSGRVFITTNPTLSNYLIGPWAVVGGTDFASYNATYGVGALGTAGFAGYDLTNTITGASSSKNLLWNTGTLEIGRAHV